MDRRDGQGLHIHLDLVGGMAGDMFVAAALDAGLVERQALESELRKVGLGPIEIATETVVRGAIEGRHIQFGGWPASAESDHRHLTTIRTMLTESDLSDPVKHRAIQMFECLGRAEAKVHGMDVEDVHFHEVGAVDSILDFVAAAWIMESLDGASWSVGVVPVGKGTIETAHGTIPLPAPATAEVLRGFEVEYRDVKSEFVTPTGATILAALSALSGDRRGTLMGHGVGCGSRDVEGLSNVLRMVVLRADERRRDDASAAGAMERQEILQLVTEVDDESPEITAHVAEDLRTQGALDVICEPVQMKKGRIGTRLSVLCDLEDELKLVESMMRQTSTLGIRRYPVQRWVVAREQRMVMTQYGEVVVKVAQWKGKPLKVSPEYESCARRAKQAQVAVREVFAAAIEALRSDSGSAMNRADPTGDDFNGG